jgi:hypothetical protein
VAGPRASEASKPVAPVAAAAPAAPVAAAPQVASADTEVLVFENPLSLIQAERAGSVKLGSIVQVSGTLHPNYTTKPDAVSIVYPPDVKWYANSVFISGAVAQCNPSYTAGSLTYGHRVENLKTGDRITVRGRLNMIAEPMIVPGGGMTRFAMLGNCDIIR